MRWDIERSHWGDHETDIEAIFPEIYIILAGIPLGRTHVLDSGGCLQFCEILPCPSFKEIFQDPLFVKGSTGCENYVLKIT